MSYTLESSIQYKLFGFAAESEEMGTEFGLVVAGTANDATQLAAELTDVPPSAIELIDPALLVTNQYGGCALLTTGV